MRALWILGSSDERAQRCSHPPLLPRLTAAIAHHFAGESMRRPRNASTLPSHVLQAVDMKPRVAALNVMVSVR